MKKLVIILVMCIVGIFIVSRIVSFMSEELVYKIFRLLIMFIIGGIISYSPINLMLHELLHKLCLNKLGVKSKITLYYYYVKFELETLKWSFVSDKKERVFYGNTNPVWDDFNKCNKKQKVIVHLLPTIILTFISIIILISYLLLFNEPITSNFSILMMSIILCDILMGQDDMIDTYKLCVNK